MSARKTAIPRAMGVDIARASSEEYRVPQRKGSAPNSPETGSQVRPAQKPKPNLAMDRRDCLARTTKMPTTRTMTIAAIAPVTPLKRRPSDLDVDDGRDMDDLM